MATSFPGRDFGEIFPRWWFWPDRSLSSFCPGLVALLMFRSHARSDCRPGPGRPTAHRGPLRPGSGPRRGGASRPPWPGISVARRPRGAAAGPAGRPPEFAGVQSWRHPFPMQHPQDGAGGTLEVHSDPPEAGAPVPHPPHRLHLVGPELPRRPQDLPPALSPRPWRNRRASSCCTPGWNGQKYSFLPGRNKPGFPATPSATKWWEFPAGAVNRAVSSHFGVNQPDSATMRQARTVQQLPLPWT